MAGTRAQPDLLQSLPQNKRRDLTPSASFTTTDHSAHHWDKTTALPGQFGPVAGSIQRGSSASPIARFLILFERPCRIGHLRIQRLRQPFENTASSMGHTVKNSKASVAATQIRRVNWSLELLIQDVILAGGCIITNTAKCCSRSRSPGLVDRSPVFKIRAIIASRSTFEAESARQILTDNNCR